jgi:conjugal transfer mating pair stabilization protein TraN
LPSRQWGEPKNPDCGGLTVNDLQGIDFDKVDLTEWIGILTSANKLPSSSAGADSMYSVGNATTSKITGTQYNPVTQRLGTQLKDANVETTRNKLQQQYQ